MCMLMISCKTTKVTSDSHTEIEVPIVNTQIEYRDRLVYDSIYCYDSVYTYIKGDTVIQYKEKINTRYLNKTDTIIRIDTIKVPVKVTNTINKTVVEEVNKLNWFQKTMVFMGIVYSLILILIIIYKIKQHF